MSWSGSSAGADYAGWTRRAALRRVVGGAAALALVGLGGCNMVANGAGLGSGRERRRLAIPPLYRGEERSGERVYDLSLQKGLTSFVDGVLTPTIGINQSFLGPTLEMRRGERVRMNVRSNLDETATLHWHGFHLPAAADGGPHQPIAPGEIWSPSFEVRQRASLFWYHSHTHRRAGPQVYAGLAAPIYVRDEEEDRLDLPADYGIDDIPLMLQDRAFAEDGRLIYSNRMHSRMMGMQGDTLLVNGTSDPVFEAKTDLLRLRLLNGSNTRFYSLAFADGRSFQLIASDGGLLERPHRTARAVLAPGERTQILVDLSDGRPAELRATSAGNMGMMNGGMMGGMMRRSARAEAPASAGEVFPVLSILPAAARRTAAALPTILTSLPPTDKSLAVRQRRFVLDMSMGMMGSFTINGKSMDMQRIDERVPVNQWEIWHIENASMMAHPFHIHDVQFRVLDRNGLAPPPQEQGLKDTVIVNPGERVSLFLRFEAYTDPDRPYMYHCHILEHEDAGMMGQFVVTA